MKRKALFLIGTLLLIVTFNLSIDKKNSNNILSKDNLKLITALGESTEVGPICYNHWSDICWRFPDMIIYGTKLP
jgi:hypothetical protein